MRPKDQTVVSINIFTTRLHLGFASWVCILGSPQLSSLFYKEHRSDTRMSLGAIASERQDCFRGHGEVEVRKTTDRRWGHLAGSVPLELVHRRRNGPSRNRTKRSFGSNE